MKNFEYVRPATIADAVAAAAEPGAAYLAGGTNLLDLMKGGIARPNRVVDISHLPGLDRIERLPDGGTRIGALVRNADLAHDPDFAKAYPGIAEALLSGASGQLRNAATVGGNLLQRTRCGYFYDPASACNKREPGTGCDARGGENRLHAVLGWSEACIATHPSDFCVPLAALDAVVEIEGRTGRREVTVEALHCLPGDTPERDNVLRPAISSSRVRLPKEARTFARACALSEGPRAHVVCFRGGVRRRRLADRTGHDLGCAAGARRRRAETVAGACAPRRLSKDAFPMPRPSAAPPRQLSPTPSPAATMPSRSNWRNASSCAP